MGEGAPCSTVCNCKYWKQLYVQEQEPAQSTMVFTCVVHNVPLESNKVTKKEAQDLLLGWKKQVAKQGFWYDHIE